ncbi:MAG: hypothetical protein OHK0017_13750 [Patescibacteria group bacterium]
MLQGFETGVISQQFRDVVRLRQSNQLLSYRSNKDKGYTYIKCPEFNSADKHSFIVFLPLSTDRFDYEKKKVQARLSKKQTHVEPVTEFDVHQPSELFIPIDRLIQIVTKAQTHTRIWNSLEQELLACERWCTTPKPDSLEHLHEIHPEHNSITIGSQKPLLKGCMLAVNIEAKQGQLDFDTACTASTLAKLGFGVIENSLRGGASVRTQHIQIAPLPVGTLRRAEFSTSDSLHILNFKSGREFTDFVSKLNNNSSIAYNIVFLPAACSEVNLGICVHDPFLNEKGLTEQEQQVYIEIYKTIGVAGFECYGNITIDKSIAISALIQIWREKYGLFGSNSRTRILKSIFNIDPNVRSTDISEHLKTHPELFNRYYYKVARALTLNDLEPKLAKIEKSKFIQQVA